MASHTSEEQRRNAPARAAKNGILAFSASLTTTDQLILMVQRRIADLWRQAEAQVPATVNWAAMYKTLLSELVALSTQGAVPDAELRTRLEALVIETQKRKLSSRASLFTNERWETEYKKHYA